MQIIPAASFRGRYSKCMWMFRFGGELLMFSLWDKAEENNQAAPPWGCTAGPLEQMLRYSAKCSYLSPLLHLCEAFQTAVCLNRQMFYQKHLPRRALRNLNWSDPTATASQPPVYLRGHSLVAVLPTSEWWCVSASVNACAVGMAHYFTQRKAVQIKLPLTDRRRFTHPALHMALAHSSRTTVLLWSSLILVSLLVMCLASFHFFSSSLTRSPYQSVNESYLNLGIFSAGCPECRDHWPILPWRHAGRGAVDLLLY